MKTISLTLKEVEELLSQIDHWTGGCDAYFKLQEFVEEERKCY